jgi:hypothetical protein
LRLFQGEVIPDLNHEILHLLRQACALGAVNLPAYFSVHVILMPVPGTIGAALSKFFTGIRGDGTADTDQNVINSAGGAVQHAAVGSFAVNNPLPFSYRCIHDVNVIHFGLLRFFTT